MLSKKYFFCIISFTVRRTWKPWVIYHLLADRGLIQPAHCWHMVIMVILHKLSGESTTWQVTPRETHSTRKLLGVMLKHKLHHLNLYLNGRLSWFNCAIHFVRVRAGVLQENMLLLGGAGQTVDYPVASPALCCPCWRRRQSPGTDSAGRTTTWLVMCFQHHYHRENTFLTRRIVIEW